VPYIKVDTRRLSNFGNVASSTRGRVGNIKSSFSSIGSSLDWDVKACSGINRTISQINNELSAEMSSLRRIETFFDLAVRKYNDAEKSKEKLSKIPQTRRVATLGPGGRMNNTTKNVALLSVYKNNKATITSQVKVKEDSEWTKLLKKIAKKAGFAGSIYGILSGESETIQHIKDGEYAKAMQSFAGVAKGVIKTVPKIFDKYGKMKKASHLLTPMQKLKNWGKSIVGLDDMIKAPSKASKVTSRIYNNMQKLDIKKLGKVTKCDVIISSIVSIIGNASEYMEGKISAARAAAETIGETVIEIGKTALLYKVVGVAATAVASAAGIAAVPAIAVAGAVVVISWGIDKLTEKLTGKNFTEWLSDGIIDVASYVGKSVKQVANTVVPAIRNTCTNVINKAGEFFGNVKNGVNNFFGKLRFAF